MQIVIEIDDDLYDTIKNLEVFITTQRSGKRIINGSINAIKNGIRLPKGHGRIADIDKVLEEMRATRTYDIPFTLERVKPIIDADKEVAT